MLRALPLEERSWTPLIAVPLGIAVGGAFLLSRGVAGGVLLGFICEEHRLAAGLKSSTDK